MFKFAVYLSKMFIFTWITVVFGFLVLIGLLDSLANGGDIVASGEGFRGTFKYMYLRAPVIFDRIFIFTLVVAILLTYVKLIRQHELVALLGFGISVPKQIMLMTPIVVGASLVSVTFIDFAMAPAVRSLQAWGIGEYKIKNITADNPLWLEDNGRIVKASTRYNYDTLGKIEIFSRTDTGEVKEIIWAERATYTDNNWRLDDVQTITIDGATNKDPVAV
ncbi:MAG: LptF/LptG family permease, partial [Litorimonas sp.]